MLNQNIAIEISELEFGWKQNETSFVVPKLSILRGSTTFIQGASGAGKSTLLGLISGILEPRIGSVTLLGTDISKLRPAQRDKFRSENMGIVFQMFNLLPFLSVGANIELPCRFSKSRLKKTLLEHKSIELAGKSLLSELGLDPRECWNKRVGELSVGQQQRVAAARAFIGSPPILIADEPTSALDSDNRNAFIELLIKQSKQDRATLLFVSHDKSLAPHFDEQLDVSDLNSHKKVGP